MVKQLDLLKLLLEATRRGKLTWRNVPNADRYEADSGGYLYVISFEKPLLDDGLSANTTLYSVSVAEALITFADGCPLVDVVEEILAAGVDEWKDHKKCVQEDMDAASARLISLIDG